MTAAAAAALLALHGWLTYLLVVWTETTMPIDAYGILPTAGDVIWSRLLMTVVLAAAVVALLRRSLRWDLLTIAACVGWAAWVTLDGLGVSPLHVALAVVTAVAAATAAGSAARN